MESAVLPANVEIHPPNRLIDLLLPHKHCLKNLFMDCVKMLSCYLFLFSLGILSCSTPTAPLALDPYVNPPIPALNPEFQTFEFMAEKGLDTTLSNGSTIAIPAGALRDQSGAVISGRVEAQYRELHDALSIYLSGVPMEYQAADTAWQFTTAGTFELRASQNSQPLSLAPEEKIAVKFASYEAADDYQIYYLDEEGRRWDSLGTRPPVINEEKVLQQKKINRKKSRLAFPLNKKYMALNYNIIADVFYNDKRVEEALHAQLKEKLEAYGLGWNGVYSYDKIEFNGQKELAGLMVWKNLSGKAFPAWTENRSCKLEKVKGSTYLLKASNKDSSETFECKLRAVMSLKSLFAFSPDYWAKNYKAAMAQVEEEQNRLKEMAAVFRHFEVADFGVYNWDRMMKEEENIPLEAQFNFAPDFNEKLTEPEVVYISGDNKSVIRFPQKDWERFSLWPQKGGILFALLPGQRLSLFTRKQYDQIDVEPIRQSLSPQYLFEMSKEVHAFSSQEELRKVLGI